MQISVIIPTYNREQYILDSVKSVMEQEGRGETYDILEILVVDDGSTDHTIEKLELFKRDNAYNTELAERIRIIPMKENGGQSGARNAGANEALGEWIAFQDSDDLWKPDKLRKQVDFLGEHNECDMVSCGYEAVDTEGEKYLILPQQSDVSFEALSSRSVIGAPTVFVNKCSFLESGGFDTELQSMEDWEFSIRFAKDHMIGMVEESLIRVRLLTDGVSSRSDNYYSARCQILAKHKDILLERGLFSEAVEKLLKDAEKNGVLPQVVRMMELLLK